MPTFLRKSITFRQCNDKNTRKSVPTTCPLDYLPALTPPAHTFCLLLQKTSQAQPELKAQGSQSVKNRMEFEFMSEYHVLEFV